MVFVVDGWSFGWWLVLGGASGGDGGGWWWVVGGGCGSGFDWVLVVVVGDLLGYDESQLIYFLIHVA